MVIKKLLLLILIFTQLFGQQKENRRSFYNVIQNHRVLISALFLIIVPLIYYVKKKVKEKRERERRIKTEELNDFLKGFVPRLVTDFDEIDVVQNNDNAFAILLFKFFFRKINSEVSLNKLNISENEYHENFFDNMLSSILEPITSYIPDFLKAGDDVQCDKSKIDFEDECQYFAYKHFFTTAKIIYKNKYLAIYFFMPYTQLLMIELMINNIQHNCEHALKNDKKTANDFEKVKKHCKKKLSLFNSVLSKIKEIKSKNEWQNTRDRFLWEIWPENYLDEKIEKAFHAGNRYEEVYEELNKIKDHLSIYECNICYNNKVEGEIFTLHETFFCTQCYNYQYKSEENRYICPYDRNILEITEEKTNNIRNLTCITR